MPSDLLHARDAFCRGDVRQGRTGYAIANGVVARDVGRVVIVHHNFAVVNDDSDVFQTDVLNVGDYTCGA